MCGAEQAEKPVHSSIFSLDNDQFECEDVTMILNITFRILPITGR